jgi:hypothetical protein
MRSQAYSAILYSLAEGIHPVTGDPLPDGLIDQPDIIRALYAGARKLEAGNQCVRVAKTVAEMPESAVRISGAVHQESDAARQEPATKSDAGGGKPAARKSDAGGGEPANKSDAVKSGDRPSPKPGRENAGKPWSKEDDLLLMEAYAAGESVNSLAKTFRRSAFAIEARLEKLESGQPGPEKRGYRIIRSSGALDTGVPSNMAAPKTP